jgi:hypothetical protein
LKAMLVAQEMENAHVADGIVVKKS